MASKSDRLDRFISKNTGTNRKFVRVLLAQSKITVDGEIAKDTQRLITPFNEVTLDGVLLQKRTAVYLILNKPQGIISATKDPVHPTVLDLIDPGLHESLHIVGRLDRNSSGLMLLTNDGSWSSFITQPDNKVIKRYIVQVEKDICEACIKAFFEGIYFPYEDITTLPASINLLSPRKAIIELKEGKYHQIKRMFGRFRNPVLSIHRAAIGNLELPTQLEPGTYRHLTKTELALLS